jgi:hypothetical protein
MECSPSDRLLMEKVEKIRAILGWEPRFDDLEKIVADAWPWESSWRGRVEGGGAVGKTISFRGDEINVRIQRQPDGVF